MILSFEPFAWEWQIMEWFYSIGNEFFNIIFWIISQLGGSIILVAILGTYYWCINKEKGERLGYTILASMCLNGVLKSIVQEQRPFQYDGKEYLDKLGDSALSPGATGSSFPSGHSQNGATVYSTIALYEKKRAITIVGIVLMIIIPISRLYLGVHFPRDVISGSLLGIASACLVYYLLKKYEKQKMWIYFLPLLVFFPFLFLSNGEHDFYRSYGLMAGFVGGIAIENRYIQFTTNVSFLYKVIRVIIGIAILGAIYFGIALLPTQISQQPIVVVIAYALITFLAIGVIPFAFKSEKHPNRI